MTALAQTLARHKAAQAAVDAVPDPEDCPEDLRDEENDALDALAFTPCASDAEFVEKLRYLLVHETRIFDGPPNGHQDFGSIVVAVDRHFNADRVDKRAPDLKRTRSDQRQSHKHGKNQVQNRPF